MESRKKLVRLLLEELNKKASNFLPFSQEPTIGFISITISSQQLVIRFRKGKKKKEKIAPSLTSAWRAELEDLSLLEGKELAARELVACSCIFSGTKGKKKEVSGSWREEVEKGGILIWLRERKHSEGRARASTNRWIILDRTVEEMWAWKNTSHDECGQSKVSMMESWSFLNR